MKNYNFNIAKLLPLINNTLRKWRIRSVLTILILFVHQSLFAQVAEVGTGSFGYSDFILVVLVLLLATIFIGLGILDDPKYQYVYPIQDNSQIVSGSTISTGYVFEKKVSTKFKIAVFSAGILVVVYAVLVFLMF